MVGDKMKPNKLSNDQQNETNSVLIKNDPELIATSKFYSKPQPQHSEIKKESIQSSDNNLKDYKEKKKNERTSSKNKQLGTWQANLTSQLLLPDDFTPELISQLASEGYDVVSAASGIGGRKARSRQTQQPSFVNNFIDSSDEENSQTNDCEDSSKSDSQHAAGFPAAVSNVNKSSRTNNSGSNQNNGEGYRGGLLKLNKNLPAKLDCQDPTDHPSYKRFNQILEDLLDSFEQDLIQLNRNKNRNEGLVHLKKIIKNINPNMIKPLGYVSKRSEIL
jgi:hypothetical protein